MIYYLVKRTAKHEALFDNCATFTYYGKGSNNYLFSADTDVDLTSLKSRNFIRKYGYTEKHLAKRNWYWKHLSATPLGRDFQQGAKYEIVQVSV